MKKKDIKILLVDDEQDILEIVGYNLSQEGYQIVTASNGREAITKAKKELPQLIIMDVMMPGGNGMRALRALKSTPVTAGIPVIITSGFNVPTQDECPQTQANHVLHKPFSHEQLLKAVNRLIPA